MIVRRVLLMLALLLAQPASAGPIAVLELDDVIGPASSDYFTRALAEADARNASAVVVRMDTPGGLDSAMRDIIRAILASPVPIVVYVTPDGARAASAGTYILYAAHVAAMAPATNLGAATPVQIGGMPEPEPGPDKPASTEDRPKPPTSAMERKMVSDAVAYIRSLAALRGRNADWAERSVREAASLPASEALAQGVIDVVATDMRDLLAKLDGRQVKLAGGTVALRTANAETIEIEPDWRSDLLAIITNPNIAYILMLIGIYGLIFELANPGSLLPGVLGGICLLLALFAFQTLPINYAGVALILLGLAFMVAEAFMPSFGILGIGGVVAFVIGSVILLDTESPAFELSLWLVGGFAVASLAVLLGVITLATRAHSRPVVSGAERMVGSEGEVLADFAVEGQVRVHGEIWSATADTPVFKGDHVRVLARDGLRLRVERLGPPVGG